MNNSYKCDILQLLLPNVTHFFIVIDIMKCNIYEQFFKCDILQFLIPNVMDSIVEQFS